MNDTIFYLGSIVIIGGFIIVVIVKFKNDSNIDLSQNLFLIIGYIILLIGAIILWREITITITQKSLSIENYNKSIQKIING